MIKKKFDGKVYNIPYLLEVRFDFLTTKIIYSEQENYIELSNGCRVLFNCEFKDYECKS